MKALILVLLYLFTLFLPLKSYAIFNPLEHPNNFHGIHILFPSELEEASKLVNSNTGEWGYVTIPIQSGDKDLEKWQKFMDDCKKLKLIPIIRLSTEGHFEDSSVWRIPTETDILDFANFLGSLQWPIENRYIVVFNEVNRFDEWGGKPPNPEIYSDLLSYAIDTFKEKSGDFYIIMSGLDNAAPNDGEKYMDNFVFIKRMAAYNKRIFDRLDGFASHSYPNPNFSQPPLLNKREGVTTYMYEYELINSYTTQKKPAFILETGWHSENLGEGLVASYYKTAYDQIWGKDTDKIVAITPFLLQSQGGSFDKFSFIRNGLKTQYYKEGIETPKVKGEPLIKVAERIVDKHFEVLKTRKFADLSIQRNLGNLLVLNYIRFFF